MTRTIRVAERGATDVAVSDWSTLAADDEFWRLVREKIVAVGEPSRGKRRLAGSCFVGRARFGDVILELHEKVPGAVENLIGFATHDSFRVKRVPSPATDLGKLATLLIRTFLERVREYAQRGREFFYTTRRDRGSLIGGRLDVLGTMRLRARGLGHLATFHRNVIAYNTSLNVVVAHALIEIERLAPVVGLDASSLSLARSFAELFADCDVVDPRATPGVIPQSLADDLTALANVILEHQSFERAEPLPASAPRSWFLNLEALFETAVRRTLERIARPAYTVRKGASHAPQIFTAAGNRYRAEPDLVLRSTSGAGTPLVGDVKYKEWDGVPDAGDLYQLLVHGAAFAANECFLVYPADRYDVRDFGVAATGHRTRAFAVNVAALDSDLQRVLAELTPASAAAIASSSVIAATAP